MLPTVPVEAGNKPRICVGQVCVSFIERLTMIPTLLHLPSVISRKSIEAVNDFPVNFLITAKFKGRYDKTSLKKTRKRMETANLVSTNIKVQQLYNSTSQSVWVVSAKFDKDGVPLLVGVYRNKSDAIEKAQSKFQTSPYKVIVTEAALH